MRNCLECGSQKIVKNAQVFDRGDGDGKHEFEVYIDETPNSLVFKNRTYHGIRAEICGDCGFVHFFLYDPKSLWAAYQRQQNDVS